MQILLVKVEDRMLQRKVLVSEIAEAANNIHSQNGEDGVLAKIFEILKISSGYFVEFGPGMEYI